jgi:hypothetical protein
MKIKLMIYNYKNRDRLPESHDVHLFRVELIMKRWTDKKVTTIRDIESRHKREVA